MARAKVQTDLRAEMQYSPWAAVQVVSLAVADVQVEVLTLRLAAVQVELQGSVAAALAEYLK